MEGTGFVEGMVETDRRKESPMAGTANALLH
jgi:hypothetical protein